MAMTKKEQAQVNLEIAKWRHMAALHWTPDVRPDVEPPSFNGGSSKYHTGFDFNVHTGQVFEAWSGCTSHGTGQPPQPGKYGYGSQGARHLYSTRLRALQALRHAVESASAARLVAIDKLIEAEQAG